MEARKQVNENVRPTDAGQVTNQALQTVQDIVCGAVSTPSEAGQARAKRLAELDALRITTRTEVEPEESTLRVDGVGIFALRDLHAVKGKQKSGKSSVLKVMLAALLGGSQFRLQRAVEEPVVLFLDTEQKAEDVKLVIGQLQQMAGCTDEYTDSHLFLYGVRRLSYDTLLQDTRLLIDSHRPQVVFIDGVVDFVASFNDEVLSRRLVQDLLLLCDEYNCAIVCALHENKAQDDENMRGHLGTVLAQKAANILRCQKSRTGLITVSCPDSRHQAMPQWSIAYDPEGHIVDADAIKSRESEEARRRKAEARQARQQSLVRQRLDTALGIIREHSGSLLRSELTATMQQRLQVSRSAVSKFLTKMLAEGALFESGKYIMNATDTRLPL